MIHSSAIPHFSYSSLLLSTLFDYNEIIMLEETIATYITFLSSREQDIGSRHTTEAYRNDLTQLCDYLTKEGIQDWQQVTREQIATYLLRLREGFAYRATTISRKFASLKSFFRFLYENEILIEDLLEDADTPDVQRDLPQILSQEQIDLLFAQVDSETIGGLRDLAMLHTLYSTGMRVSELVALDMEDFNEEEATVTCPGHGKRFELDRVLPISSSALAAVQAYLEEARPRLVRSPADQQHALFLNHHGERLSRQGFWLIVKGYAYRAGIYSVTPNTLRHSFAIAMLKEGHKMREVQTMLGHARLATTKVYTQLIGTPED